MQLYDTVELIEDIDNFKKGSIGVIVELYNDKCYLEIIDNKGQTLGILYDVPISKLYLCNK